MRQLEEEHQRTATDTSSAQIDTVDVDTHFIAFVEKGGNLYEMDGRKVRRSPPGDPSDSTG